MGGLSWDTLHFSRIRYLRWPRVLHHGKRKSSSRADTFPWHDFYCHPTRVPHLRDLKSGCSKHPSLRMLSHLSCSANYTDLLCLCCSSVLPNLDFGCQLYSSATASHLRIIGVIYHAGVQVATGALQSCPILSLLVDAGVLPFGLHRQSVVARFWYGTQSLPCSPTCSTVLVTCLDYIFFSVNLHLPWLHFLCLPAISVFE